METVLYDVAGPVATITLNRPEALNTIVPPMPDEVEQCVGQAVRDPAVRVIVVRGAGRAFCAGYDFGVGFHHWDEWITTDGAWDPGKDFALATAPELSPTQKFMSVWRAPKPVIAQVHGWCVGGGSDFALCCDLIVASEDAVIGTPYSRMWGAYLSGMWVYRLGLARAKQHALTGKPLSGREAADVELINEAVPFAELEARVAALAEELASIPSSQLAAMKLVVNHAYENMGLASTQTLGPILDGLMRNTPEAIEWIRRAEAEGVRVGGRRARRPVRGLQPGAAGAAARPVARHRAVRVRAAVPSEREALEALQRRASDVWEEYRADLAAHPDAIALEAALVADGRVRVAEGEAGELLGFSVLLAPRDGACELDGLFVEPAAMRGGVGRALVADAVQRARAEGAQRISVIANPRATGFYERVGFVEGEPAQTRFGPAAWMHLTL